MANEQWQMAIAIAKVCQIDMRLATKRQKGAVMQTAKHLRDAKIAPEQVESFGAYWEAVDWRGQRGSPPVPAQIRTEWGKFSEW
jgi:hypothetical protein